jgi:hypothetical protein
MGLIRENFDKIILSLFVLYFSLMGFHSIYIMELHKVEITNPLIQTFMNTMFDNQKLVIGALLGLITGRAFAKGDKPNDVSSKVG